MLENCVTVPKIDALSVLYLACGLKSFLLSWGPRKTTQILHQSLFSFRIVPAKTSAETETLRVEE